mmetsp:Transcript_44597/g.72599  ORF Transcript_44597/g.72599 Transcript_44597/m.72599 type:complete len:282 (-) Transcript_44597:1732-2577(-)
MLDSRCATSMWPPGTSLLSRPALASSTSCLKRFLSSRLTSVITSRTMASRSSVWWGMAFPRTNSHICCPFTLSSALDGADVKVLARMPPVFWPIRCVSCTKSSFEVPMFSRERVKSGTYCSSSRGISDRSNAKSTYAISFVKSGCRRTVPGKSSLGSNSSVGTSLIRSSMSFSESVGILARSSGVSSASCLALRSFVMRTASSTPCSPSASFALARRAFSASSCFCPTDASGFRTTVSRCVLSKKYSLMRFSKYLLLGLASSVLMCSNGASYLRGAYGSPP